jgi:hypothetical protein
VKYRVCDEGFMVQGKSIGFRMYDMYIQVDREHLGFGG